MSRLLRGATDWTAPMSESQELTFSPPRPVSKRSVLVEARSKVSTCSFHAEPQEPLLYAALRAGVAIPYECGTGTCGTCKARRLAGVVVADSDPCAE
jgi:Na+-transporting NADH:ubiquinone oxidoreductase subunit NqrF